MFQPYEIRRTKHEHLADATHGFWKRVGDRVATNPTRVLVGSTAVLLVMCAGLAFFSTDLTTNDSYRTEVESVQGQELLAQSFPSGASAPTDVIVPDRTDVPAVTRAVEGVEGVESVSPPVAEGERGVLVQATLEPQPYSTEAFDLIEPIRAAAHEAAPGTLVGGATAVEFDVREAAGWDSTVIPPIVLVVVFLILVLLLRAVVAPLILIGTVIVSFLAALGGATSSSRRSSTSPARIRRCRSSRSCFWSHWGSTTTSSSWHARARRRSSTAPARGSCARWP